MNIVTMRLNGLMDFLLLHLQMNRLSSPSIVMESQLNGHFGENSSSSSSNSSAAYPANSSSDTSSATAKPYKPKFHNYKKLDLTKTTPLVTSSVPAGTGASTPSTPSTPSFFSTNAGQLVRNLSRYLMTNWKLTLLISCTRLICRPHK